MDFEMWLAYILKENMCQPYFVTVFVLWKNQNVGIMRTYIRDKKRKLCE